MTTDEDLDPPPSSQTQTSPAQTEPALAPEVQDAIGRGLRAMYESLKAEPVPDHLLALIRKLDEPGGSPGR